MAKKKRLIRTPEDRARSAEILRLLEERIAILDRKIAARTQQSRD
jgi:hypothetical protein